MIKNKILIIIICMIFILTEFLPFVSSGGKLTFSSDINNINFSQNNLNFNDHFDLDTPNVIIELDMNGISYGHELLWIANTTGTNYEESAVTYLDGIAYIGSCSTHGDGHDKLFAVDTSSGEIIWSFDTGPGYVGPVIDGDFVYIGSDSHGNDPGNEYMFAINRFTGKEIWNRKIYGGIPESVQYDNEKIYFSSDTIYALNKINGSIIWTYKLDSLSVTKPILKDDFYYTASSNGKLYKIDSENGNRIWSVILSAGPWDNSITSDNEGHIFLAIYRDKTINCYYESNGSLIWSYKLHRGSLSFNAYHNGVVFISDTYGYVYAINSGDGTLIWEKKIGDKFDISSPTVSNGLLFIGTRDGDNGAFYVLDETSGDVVWKYHVGSSVTAPPSIADGIMFCGTDGWYMYAFDFGTGSGDWILHRYDKYNTACSPDGLTSWQYVLSDCTTKGDVTTCILTNYYDHDVINVNLELNINANWYDSSGNLMKYDSDSFVIDELASLSSMTIILSEKELQPPNKPSTPSGPKSGKINMEYEYSTSTIDPDGDNVFYLFDWGDGTDSGWLGPIVSGATIKANNTWTSKGSYIIRVKAKDPAGFESQWSDPININLPKIKNFKNLVLQHIQKQVNGLFTLIAKQL